MLISHPTAPAKHKHSSGGKTKSHKCKSWSVLLWSWHGLTPWRSLHPSGSFPSAYRQPLCCRCKETHPRQAMTDQCCKCSFCPLELYSTTFGGQVGRGEHTAEEQKLPCVWEWGGCVGRCSLRCVTAGHVVSDTESQPHFFLGSGDSNQLGLFLNWN